MARAVGLPPISKIKLRSLPAERRVLYHITVLGIKRGGWANLRSRNAHGSWAAELTHYPNFAARVPAAGDKAVLTRIGCLLFGSNIGRFAAKKHIDIAVNAALGWL